MKFGRKSSPFSNPALGVLTLIFVDAILASKLDELLRPCIISSGIILPPSVTKQNPCIDSIMTKSVFSYNLGIVLCLLCMIGPVLCTPVLSYLTMSEMTSYLDELDPPLTLFRT